MGFLTKGSTDDYSAATLRCIGGQHRIELAGTVQGDQIFVAADMELADIDLRHRPPPCLAHHLHATRRLEVDPNLGDFGHALRAQETLGVIAVRAHRGRVHHDLRHHALSAARRSSILPSASPTAFSTVFSTAFSITRSWRPASPLQP